MSSSFAFLKIRSKPERAVEFEVKQAMIKAAYLKPKRQGKRNWRKRQNVCSADTRGRISNSQSLCSDDATFHGSAAVQSRFGGTSWQWICDVSKQHIHPVFKDQAVYKCLPTFLGISVSSSRAKKPEKNSCFTAWPFKMGPIFCPETSVSNCQPTPPDIPEERTPFRSNDRTYAHTYYTFHWKHPVYNFRNFNSATLEQLTIDIPKFQMAPLPSPFFYCIRHPAVQVDEDNCERTCKTKQFAVKQK